MGQASENGSHAEHGHPSHLQHHFDTPVQQYDSGKLGMWLFLATEIVLFGGLFVAYAVYRANHPEIFLYAHTFLDTNLGAINTVILLCSSLTMAWAVRAAQLSQQRLLVVLLSLTLLGGFGFLSIKYVEYKAKWEHGLLWARSYDPTHGAVHEEEHAVPEAEDAAPAPEEIPGDTTPAGESGEPTETAAPGSDRTSLPPAASGPVGRATQSTEDGAHEVPADAPKNVQVFFSIYFLMTGLHGIHVIAGMLAIAWALRKALRGTFSGAYFTPVDLVGLYWHLVDLIWIFLFPLLYLIG